MKSFFTLLRREYWEYRGAFIVLPLVLVVLLFSVSLYAVIWRASPDSEFMNGFYMGQQENGNIDFGLAAGPDDYIVDFNKGALVKADASTLAARNTGYRSESTNTPLYAIHAIYMCFMGLALFFGYLLNCLHADRKDRSVLFWKSMPISETRNVMAKLVTATVAVPVLMTVISWAAQILFIVMSMLFVYRSGSDPWTVIWSRLDIMQAFFNQLVYILWFNLWVLPITAWLLFSSAFAKSVPILIALAPGAIFILEYFLFGTTYAWQRFVGHFAGASINMNEFVNNSVNSGIVSLPFDTAKLTMDIVISAALLTGAVWLRNHRFEI